MLTSARSIASLEPHESWPSKALAATLALTKERALALGSLVIVALHIADD